MRQDTACQHQDPHGISESSLSAPCALTNLEEQKVWAKANGEIWPKTLYICIFSLSGSSMWFCTGLEKTQDGVLAG